MLRRALAAITCAALLYVPPAAACSQDGYAESYPRVKALHSADVAKLVKRAKKSAVALIDVNHPPFRERHGALPGATTVSSAEAFAAEELPKSRSTQLIFYCTNMRCEASWVAAERARTAGYKNVAVLVEGILGWKHAGHPTETIAPQS